MGQREEREGGREEGRATHELPQAAVLGVRVLGLALLAVVVVGGVLVGALALLLGRLGDGSDLGPLGNGEESAKAGGG